MSHDQLSTRRPVYIRPAGTRKQRAERELRQCCEGAESSQSSRSFLIDSLSQSIDRLQSTCVGL